MGGRQRISGYCCRSPHVFTTRLTATTQPSCATGLFAAASLSHYVCGHQVAVCGEWPHPPPAFAHTICRHVGLACQGWGMGAARRPVSAVQEGRLDSFRNIAMLRCEVRLVPMMQCSRNRRRLRSSSSAAPVPARRCYATCSMRTRTSRARQRCIWGACARTCVGPFRLRLAMKCPRRARSAWRSGDPRLRLCSRGVGK